MNARKFLLAAVMVLALTAPAPAQATDQNAMMYGIAVMITYDSQCETGVVTRDVLGVIDRILEFSSEGIATGMAVKVGMEFKKLGRGPWCAGMKPVVMKGMAELDPIARRLQRGY